MKFFGSKNQWYQMTQEFGPHLILDKSFDDGPIDPQKLLLPHEFINLIIPLVNSLLYLFK